MAKSKKIAIVVAAIALIAVIGVVGSTLAFFTDKDTKKNTFTMGNVSGTLEEKENKNGEPTLVDGTGIDFPNITPGADLYKEPFMVLGDGSSDAYARMNVRMDISNVPESVQKEVREDIYGQIAQQIAEQSNPAKWVAVQENDGSFTYYYQDKLTKENKQTLSLFTHIVFNGGKYDNRIANMHIEMPIRGDFIQADNMENQIQRNGSDQIVSWGTVDIKQFNAPQQ